MVESNPVITNNQMITPDSFFDALLDSLLDSLPRLTAGETEGLKCQDAELIPQTIFSESCDTVESLSLENDILPSASESSPTQTVSGHETQHVEREKDVDILSDQIDPLSGTFFVGLTSEIMGLLSQTKEFARFSEKNLPNNGSKEYFIEIGNKIEKIEGILDSYVKFHKISTPARKVNTVHAIIEKVLKKHEDKLRKKNVLLFRKFEDDLPEIIVHDKQLEYILDNLVQSLIKLISPNGGIGLFTRFRERDETVTERKQDISHKDFEYVSILFVLTVCARPAKLIGKKLRMRDYRQEDILLGLMMRFIEEAVRKNQGLLEIEVNDEKKKTFFIMRFPVERRQVVVYDLGDD